MDDEAAISAARVLNDALQCRRYGRGMICRHNNDMRLLKVYRLLKQRLGKRREREGVGVRGRGGGGEFMSQFQCARVLVSVSMSARQYRHPSLSPTPSEKKKKKKSHTCRLQKRCSPRTTPPLRDATPDACHAYFSALAVAQETFLVQSHVSMCHVSRAPRGGVPTEGRKLTDIGCECCRDLFRSRVCPHGRPVRNFGGQYSPTRTLQWSDQLVPGKGEKRGKEKKILLCVCVCLVTWLEKDIKKKKLFSFLAPRRELCRSFVHCM